MGFAKAKENYYIVIEEGILPQGPVIHRTIIPTSEDNALAFSDHIRQVVTGGLVIAKEGEMPPLPEEGDLG